MARPIRSFAKRQAEAEKQDVLAGFTTTERLLVEILIQLLSMQARRDMSELAAPLKRAGLTTKQVAALLDTSPASLAVTTRRRRLKETAETDDEDTDR